MNLTIKLDFIYLSFSLPNTQIQLALLLLLASSEISNILKPVYCSVDHRQLRLNASTDKMTSKVSFSPFISSTFAVKSLLLHHEKLFHSRNQEFYPHPIYFKSKCERSDQSCNHVDITKFFTK